MDYLDPKKQFRHKIILIVGYVLTGIAIVIGTLVLLYQAYGFGLGKNGTVIQNGLFFFSSQPHPASIYVDGKLKSVKTNTRLSLPAGVYSIDLKRDGYRDWHRVITLDGGSVEHFDYPLLVPDKLISSRIADYVAPPGLVTQSPDHRWLLVQKPGTITGFDVYDLKNPDKSPLALTLPGGLLSKSAKTESWQFGEWAGDNRHVLLRHIYDGKSEFIMLDRTDPAKAVNLTTKLSLNATDLTLNNKKYDQYYAYNAVSHQLYKASLKAPAPAPFLEHVLSYRSYSDDTMLYTTSTDAPAGRVLVKLLTGGKTLEVRTLPAGSNYLLDLTEYSGTMYAAIGAASDNKVYIYKDPIGQLEAKPGHVPVPAQILHVTAPNYLSFSDNAQFIMTESGTEFGVYDIENKEVYHYTTQQPLDAPQSHAGWMDGDRLTYITGGKMVIFDYDNANRQTLVSANSQYEPAFSPDYKFIYTLAPASSGPPRTALSQTSLLIPADQ